MIYCGCFSIDLLTWLCSDLNTSVDGVDDAVGFKEGRMGDGNAIGCPVTAEPQFLQLLHTLSASRFMASSFVISFAGFLTGDFLLIEFGRHEITTKKHRWLKRDRATNRSNTRE
ncbi:hypothetical protein PRIPAC_90647 [Pristionchus pacificus]|uniref:Uncharacterized protein n=1 Tax=Pristionchus pacificus TaxID=54126 RepID=A0A2A6B3S6_PRIPA|nr:hypothetical protein PRIPAC_90647 [Pristionchus pacificus]|eukprot:PDM60511.1 hypothetical protein PRIPAC_53489 [Pristionchus pacificus]